MPDLSSDQRHRLLVNSALEFAMIMIDADGVIREWSRGAEALLGWTAQEIVGRPAQDIFTLEDRTADVPRAELHTALALGHAADVRWHARKDGSSVFCDGTVNRIMADDGVTLLGYGKVMREAYTRKKDRPGEAISARSERRSFLAAVLESIENGIVACDRQGKLTFFNDAARAIHGMQEHPVSSEHWAEQYRLYRPDGAALLEREHLPLYRALQGERVDAERIVVESADGTRRHVQVSGRPLEDAAGQVLGAVVSMQDLSAQQAAHTAREDAVREQGRRIAAEEAQSGLSKTQELLRLATEAAQLGIWTWDAGRDAGTWENARMYEIFQRPVDGPIVNATELLNGLLHADDAPAFLHAVDATLQHGERLQFTGRFRPAPDADMRWVEITGMLRAGASDSPVIIGTAADVTLRKQLEKAAEEGRVRLEATLSAGDVGIWIWDIQGDRVTGDRNLASLFGVADGDAAELPLSMYTDAIHPDDAEEVARQIRHATDTGEAYRATYRIRDGQGGWRWVNARGRIEFDAQGRPGTLAGVMLDITPQVEAEAGLRAAEERYRTLITSMDEAFAIVQVLVDDAGRPVDYRFEEVNRALELQSGLVNAAGRTIREMVPDIEERWIERYGKVALSRQPVRFTEHSAAMGYWWDVYATPMGHPDERRIAILFTDVTARRKAEKELRQLAADLSETNRRKTEFLATLAHELRNPLAPMRTGLDLIRMAGREAPGGPKVMEMMDRQLRQMVHLIDDLMDVSRINNGKIVLKKECIDLQSAIANAVETALPAIEAAGHAVRVDLPPDALMVEVDRTRLAQILANLLANAVKYTPNGGAITVAAARSGAAMRIEVSDTGIGIPAEEQARVFDMFSQVSRNMGRAQGGLGIGLSLVRSLVDLHDGSVAVSSVGMGKGSTFTVELPEAPDCPPPGADTGAAALAAQARDAGLRILIADDNVDAAHLLADLLEISGHAVSAVHDGREALEHITADRPDMAILDIGMPGLNGYEVARTIRATPGMDGTVLVALTGWGGELDRSRSKEAGFDAHLTKPASVDELERMIAQVRGARPAA
ncbi:PAS domain S-box protein [uncultured Massilia sp.]|uniref:PAS domain S-box protein n=1 Tax=uncultured Massilia sp. TaxID=169973 RepID=UPI0025839833|nr:PAS domain S-box protein [uncultured Massilia sp.]